MSAIPSAKVFAQVQEEKVAAHVAAKVAEQAQTQVKWNTRLVNASDDFVRDMTRRLVKAIETATASSHPSRFIGLRIAKLPQYQGLPGDVLLYGHRRDEGWYNRAPLEIATQPFETLQAAFYASEWFLIEESDPSKSFTIIFRLFSAKPAAHSHLWHGHNLFDEEKIKSLASPKVEDQKPMEEQM